MVSATGEAKQKAKTGDERLMRENNLKRLLRRPELAAVVGAIAVWIFFAIAGGKGGFLSFKGTANYLEVSAQLGILAVAVSMLMIGGEFDLSIGSMMGAAGMITALMSSYFGLSLWLAMGVSLVVCLIFGAINGLLVTRTKLPSFIITLGSLFVIRGLTIGLTRIITKNTIITGLKDLPDYGSVSPIFISKAAIGDGQFAIAILWWILIAIVASYILWMTRPGNWIYAIGGDEKAARNVGVPVDRMKILLFMGTAAAAWLVATTQVLWTGSADTLRGEQREFFAIIAAVIGGTLLTGGYGSAIGAMFGALIVGMVQQGVVFASIPSDFFQVFVGSTLIIAVLINNFIRKQASEVK
jgi:simple sugar transport system permease protein